MRSIKNVRFCSLNLQKEWANSEIRVDCVDSCTFFYKQKINTRWLLEGKQIDIATRFRTANFTCEQQMQTSVGAR